MYKLENNLHGLETYLSIITAIPVIGVVGGAGKVCLGLIQTISAIAISLIAGITAIFGLQQGKELCLRASKHILHGMGNIFAGVLESIPFAGTLSALIRYLSWNSCHPAGPGAGNYIAYGDLYKPGSSFNIAWEDIGWYDTSPLPLIKV